MTPLAVVILTALRLGVAAYGAHVIARAPVAPVRAAAPRVAFGFVLMVGSLVAL